MNASQNRRRLQSRAKGPSTTSTPTSTQTSAYPSEDEDEDDDELLPKKLKHFLFLDLPSELRNRVYGFVFSGAPAVIDLDPDNYGTIYRKMSIFLVCRQMCDEAQHHFYSTQTFRLFPTYPGRFFKTKKPLLARLSPRNRASISTFQLRLGPGWNKPPRGWVVNDALGLKDAVKVRILKCFIEVDPTDKIFAGFRSDIFYEKFSRKLLEEILVELPSLTEIQFDAYPSVKKDGAMVRGLVEVALQHNKLISWGPERGWNNDEGADLEEILLVKKMGEVVLSRGVALRKIMNAV